MTHRPTGNVPIDPVPAVTAGASGELTRRVLVAVVGIPVVIGLAYLGGAPLVALLAVLAALGAWELFRIGRASGSDPLDMLGIPLAAAVPVYTWATSQGMLRNPASIAAVMLLTVLGASLWVRGVAGRPLGSTAVTVLGAVYAGGMLSFALLLRHHRFVIDAAAGGALLLFPVALTWASDIGAYFVGRALGRRKLLPSVSPGKTVAGAVGAVVVTVGAAYAYNRSLLPTYAHVALTPAMAVVFGLVVSVAAQIGDLFESMLKREAGVKDSSHLLPGHGGILDRLDSLYFVLPVAFLLLDSLLLPAPSR